MKSKKAFIPAIVVIILLKFIFMKCPIHPDEGGYAYAAHFMLLGENPYKVRFLQLAPWIIWIYFATFKVFKESILGIRLVAFLFNIAEAYIIYAISKRIFKSQESRLLSVFLFLLLSWLPTIRGYMGKEIFLVLPMTISVLLIMEGHYAISGIVAGFSLAQASLPFSIPIIFAIKERKKILRFAVGWLVGTLALLLASLHYMGIKEMLHNLILYRVKNNSLVCGPIWYHPLRFIHSSLATGLLPMIIVLLATSRETILRLFLISSLAVIALGGSWFFHYYMVSIPPLSLLLGELFERGKKKTVSLLLVPPFVTLVAAIISTGSFCLVDRIGTACTENLSRFLSKNIERGSSFYAFLYRDPSLYFLSKRKSSFPNIFYDEVIFEPDKLRAIKKMIENKKAGLVVTYTLDESLKILREKCIGGIKECILSGEFEPFCKDEKLSEEITARIFKELEERYIPVKTFSCGRSRITVWSPHGHIGTTLGYDSRRSPGMRSLLSEGLLENYTE